MRSMSLVMALGLCVAPPAAAPPPLVYPPAPRIEVVDMYHGTAVADAYRWLEETNSAATRAWLAGEEALFDSFVAPLPDRDDDRKRLRELVGDGAFSAPAKAGGRYFYLGTTAGGSATRLWSTSGRQGESAHVVVEAARLGTTPEASLRACVPSPDGRLVACTVSERQSAWLRLQVVRADTGGPVATGTITLHAVAGAPIWTPDSRGLLYAEFDPPAGNDAAVAPPRASSIAWLDVAQDGVRARWDLPAPGASLPTIAITADGRFLVVVLAGPAGTEVRYADLRDASRALRPLVAPGPAQFTFLGAVKKRFWFQTDDAAPRGRVVLIDLDRPDRPSWRTVIPECADAMAAGSSVGGNALGMFGNRLVILYLHDAEPIVRVFHRDGTPEFEHLLPTGGTIWGGFSGRQDDPEVLYQFLGLTDPGSIVRLRLDRRESDVLARPPGRIDGLDVIIERVFYTGRDGTRIPMYVAHRRDLRRDGSAPGYLYGYGAFAWVSFTWYQPFVLAWIERGGVYALPALRGGGEYGQAWHEAGRGRSKQTAIDDYLEAAAWLVARGYTSSDRLVANGGSASGPLAAAAVIQSPRLFGAAVIDRPVLDMLRFDQFTQAAYWIPEFGSPADPADFAALHAWSPYHTLIPGTCYPPTLIMEGDRDPVAVPLHAYKFTAAMQAAQGCDHPVLLEVMRGAGHNFGTTPDETAAAWAGEMAFLRRVLPSGPRAIAGVPAPAGGTR